MTSHAATETSENDAISDSYPHRSIRVARDADLAFLLHLQKRWSGNVGFLPSAAFNRYIDNGQIFLVNERSQHAGYLIWTWRPDGLVRLPQVAIEPDLLRTTLGTRLMRLLVKQARSHHCSVIRLSSRTDLPANHFWPEFGFQPTAVIARPTTRGLPIIEWTLQLADTATITAAVAAGLRPFRIGKRQPPSPPRITA